MEAGSGAKRTFLFSKDVLQTFGEADFAIYNTVLRLGSAVARMQVRDLANQAHVSPASVVRFCKKCGCQGYTEFRERLKDGLLTGEIHPRSTGLDDLSEFFAHATSDAYQHELDQGFQLLRSSRHVYLFGIGQSNALANYGARLFANVGTLAFVIDDPFLPLVNVPSNGTVAMALSFSGDTPQVLAMAGDFIGAGCRLISITSSADSPLGRISDACITYRVPSYPITQSLSLYTQVPVIYTLEHLADMLYDANGRRREDTYR